MRRTFFVDKPEEGKIRILDLNAETFIKVFHEPYFYEMTNLVVLPETPSRIIDKLSFPDQEYEYDMLDFSCTSLSDRRIHFQTDLQVRKLKK